MMRNSTGIRTSDRSLTAAIRLRERERERERESVKKGALENVFVRAYARITPT